MKKLAAFTVLLFCTFPAMADATTGLDELAYFLLFSFLTAVLNIYCLSMFMHFKKGFGFAFYSFLNLFMCVIAPYYILKDILSYNHWKLETLIIIFYLTGAIASIYSIVKSAKKSENNLGN